MTQNIRNEYLFYPPHFATVPSKLTNQSTNTVRFSDEDIAESYGMETRGQSADEEEAFKTAAQLEEITNRGQSTDAGSFKGLSSLKQKGEIKKMLENRDSLTFETKTTRDVKSNYLKKQRLAKELMHELSDVLSLERTVSYMNVEKLADSLVTDIIKVAKKTVDEYQLQKEIAESSSEAMLHKIPEPILAIDFVEIFGSFEAWPKIGEFSIDIGADRISDYLATWHYEENWLYDLDMILAQSDACSDFYIYEVKWSIPSKEYPVPQATASVFFTIEVSRVIPLDCFVNVTYKYEGCDYIHEPFKHSFQEQWLFNIIEAKLKFFKTITF